jgi:hypothetical protein
LYAVSPSCSSGLSGDSLEGGYLEGGSRKVCGWCREWVCGVGGVVRFRMCSQSSVGRRGRSKAGVCVYVLCVCGDFGERLLVGSE